MLKGIPRYGVSKPPMMATEILLDGLPVYTSSLAIITPPPCSPIFLLFLLFSSFSTATLLNPIVVEVVSIVSGGDRLDGVCGVAMRRFITPYYTRVYLRIPSGAQVRCESKEFLQH